MMVALALWVARLLVAAVFGWAALAKLLDLPGTRRAVASFGVPDRWVRSVALALPVVELLVAVSILLPWTAVVAGMVAFGLLGVFSVVVARLLMLGRRPACPCFGASGPISGFTLVRNALLGILVLTATVGASDAVPVGYAVGSAAVVVLGTVQLWQGLALRRLRPAPADPVEVAPVFDLPDTAGEQGGLYTALAAGLPVVLLFLSPGCAPCVRIAQELPQWRERLNGKAAILLIGNGAVAEISAWAREHRVGTMLVQQNDELSARYRLPGLPSAVLVDSAGRIAAPIAGGRYAIRELLTEVCRS